METAELHVKQKVIELAGQFMGITGECKSLANPDLERHLAILHTFDSAGGQKYIWDPVMDFDVAYQVESKLSESYTLSVLTDADGVTVLVDHPDKLSAPLVAFERIINHSNNKHRARAYAAARVASMVISTGAKQ
ncbi:MAG: hypothetical protein ACTS9Y_00475 [Methylophilus sp.]|uniref:hypothetical protein n=1 Tax=Methylophilus sp. TaxID=29541 RepID=UPI003FA017A7